MGPETALKDLPNFSSLEDVEQHIKEHTEEFDGVTNMPSKYHREINGAVVDVYDIIVAYSVNNPAAQHALKKLLMPGQRGAKDTITDLKEAKVSVERAIAIEEAQQ